MIEKKRCINLDLVRTVAIIFVVYIHCHETITLSIPILSQILYYLGRCGVPLFFLITGSLVFNKKITFKKIVKLYFISFFWCITCNITYYLIYGKDPNLHNDFSKLLFISLRLNAFPKHLWYLKEIFTIYFFYFIKNILEEHMSNKQTTLFIIYILFFIYTFINCSYYNIVAFIGFFISHIGYIIYNKKLFDNLNNLPLIIGLIMSYIIFIFTFNLIQTSTTDAWWYWNPFILMGAIYLFKILLNINIKKDNKIF